MRRRDAIRRGTLASLVVAVMALAACGPSQVNLPSILPPPSAPAAACDSAKQWRPPAGNVALNDMAMVAPDEGWAVGALTPHLWDGGSVPTGVIYHLVGGQWRMEPQTYPGAALTVLSMDSPTDGWAASATAMTGAGDRALVLHDTGGVWRPVDVPALDAILRGPPGTSGGSIQWLTLRMFGPDAGWLFAWTNVPRDPSDPGSRAAVVILRYLQGAWTPVPAPRVTPTTEMFMLSAVSANEAWIVGTDYGASNQATIFAHYGSAGWTLWPQTFPGVTEQIEMTSPTAGWAFDSGPDGYPALLRYDGASWSRAPLPADWVARRTIVLPYAFPMPGGATWFPASRVPSDALFLVTYSGGAWRAPPWPYPDTQPQRLFRGASGELWGVGNIAHQEGCPPAMTTYVEQGVFLHERDGVWSRHVLP